MTTVKTFRSTDPGAMILSGTPGALRDILKACLVDGPSPGAVQSLVVSGGVATATYAAAHHFVADRIALFSGATPAGLNGEQRILSAPTANTCTFAAPGVADGAATGAITSRLAPAGWAELFAGTVTNVSVFRSPDVLGTRMHLRVNDAGATVARVIGYEQMTSASVGSGLFPTEAQVSGGGYWPKSDAASTAARPWVLIADSRTFYLHLCPFNNQGGVTFAFGDGIATRPGGDPFACFLASSFQPTLENMHTGGIDNIGVQTTAMPRDFTGLGSSALHAVGPYIGNGAAISGVDNWLGPFPSLIDGGLRLSGRLLAVTGSSPRCDVPGLYHVPQSGAFSAFQRDDTVPGTGVLAGRKLMALNTTNALSAVSTATNTGVSFVDITGPWR